MAVRFYRRNCFASPANFSQIPSVAREKKVFDEVLPAPKHSQAIEDTAAVTGPDALQVTELLHADYLEEYCRSDHSRGLSKDH
ncbi:MAG: hypothetical protein DME65_07780 [Verrucomicrobia bacterium]|nr:MAG: hypothetical protein DME65_07780 [Verrucomicrobiota bacterium]